MITVFAQLVKHSLADERPLDGMMQNMHVPEAKQYLATNSFTVNSHDASGNRNSETMRSLINHNSPSKYIFQFFGNTVLDSP